MEYRSRSTHRRLASSAQEGLCILYVQLFFAILVLCFFNTCVGYGWAGTCGYIDPQTGIAAVFGTQVVPSLDGEVYTLTEEFERTLYSNLQ